MDERDGDESTDEEYTYCITLHSVRDKVQPLTEVIIGDRTMKCLIESGAGVNVIDSCSFNQLENVHLLPTSKKSCRYRSTEPLSRLLIVDLNGATVFSKIDLNQGYHQFELEKNCRSITTFATHVGLFRYKRLSFGVNSAAEIFQKSIEEVLN